jgi:hypothetical protein
MVKKPTAGSKGLHAPTSGLLDKKGAGVNGGSSPPIKGSKQIEQRFDERFGNNIPLKHGGAQGASVPS